MNKLCNIVIYSLKTLPMFFINNSLIIYAFTYFRKISILQVKDYVFCNGKYNYERVSVVKYYFYMKFVYELLKFLLLKIYKLLQRNVHFITLDMLFVTCHEHTSSFDVGI